jgi:hypothetical protein
MISEGTILDGRMTVKDYNYFYKNGYRLAKETYAFKKRTAIKRIKKNRSYAKKQGVTEKPVKLKLKSGKIIYGFMYKLKDW